MSLESELNKKDLLSLWRQHKSERDSFLNLRDRLDATCKKIDTTNFLEIADNDEKALFADTKSKISKIK